MKADALSVAALEAGLSPSEAQVLFLAAEGLGYAEIGRRLHISEGAAQRRCSRAHRKLLDHHARLQSVVWCQRADRTAGEREAWRQRVIGGLMAGS